MRSGRVELFDPRNAVTTSEPTLPQAAGWPFLISSLLGRLPASMLQLGYLMVLSQLGLGLGLAGLVVAAVGLGGALGAVFVGRLVDRHGPAPVLLGASLVSLLGQGALLACLLRGVPTGLLLGCAVLVGASNPQIGAVVRSHWSYLAVRLRSPQLVSRALGYEGAIDELGFVVGPVLASVLVTWLGAIPATVCILVLTAVLQGLFVFQLWVDRGLWRGRIEAARVAKAVAPASRVGIAVVWPMVACLGVGLLFGATQTGLTAVFTERGTPGLTGLVYGLVGVGSGLASLVMGRLVHRFPVAVRVFAGGLLMAAGAALLMQLPGVALAAAIALMLGAGAGVTLISSFGWMESIAPRDRVATMMTLLTTCLPLGVSVGAATAGQLAADPAQAFLPVLVSGLLGVLAAAGMRFVRRGPQRPLPNGV